MLSGRLKFFVHAAQTMVEILKRTLSVRIVYNSIV
jgi:hypothetical protein